MTITSRIDAISVSALCATLALSACTPGGLNLDPAAPTISPPYVPACTQKSEESAGAQKSAEVACAQKSAGPPGTLSWLVLQAGNLTADYDSRYQSQARFQAFPFDIPIVGLAIAAAGNLILGGSTTTSAILGLSAGGLTAFSLYWNPGGMQTAYAQGASKASCIFTNGTTLLNFVNDDSQLKDTNNLFQTANNIVDVRTAVISSGYLTADGSSSKKITSSEATALKAAFDSAEKTISLLESERTSARQSASVANDALRNTTDTVIAATKRQPASFANAQASIVDALKTEGANAQVFADLRRQLAGRPAEEKPTKVAAGLEALSPADLAALPAAQLTALLIDATTSLIASIPPVSQLNAQIAACAPIAAR